MLLLSLPFLLSLLLLSLFSNSPRSFYNSLSYYPHSFHHSLSYYIAAPSTMTIYSVQIVYKKGATSASFREFFSQMQQDVYCIVTPPPPSPPPLPPRSASVSSIQSWRHHLSGVFPFFIRILIRLIGRYFSRVGHPFFSKECSVLCVLLRSL